MGKTKISKIFANAGTPVDPDAFAFITAAAITDYSQKQAINKLVNDLKTNSLWNKFDCLYPMVGGDATKHSFNLKNPLRYNLTFFGGWVHSATGALPNGVNGYANTNFSGILLQQNSVHLSYYSRTQNVGAFLEMGFGNGGNAPYVALWSCFSGGCRISANNISVAEGANTVSKTFFITSRTASNVIKSFLNSTVLYASAILSDVVINRNIYLGAYTLVGDAAANHTSRQCAFASIGKGLSDAEVTAYNSIVQAFQTSLNRQNP